MPEVPEQADLAAREEDTLVFRKVGGTSLAVGDDTEVHGNQVVLAAAPKHGLVCVRDASGKRLSRQSTLRLGVHAIRLSLCSQPHAFSVTGVMHDVNWLAWRYLVALRS